MHWIVINDHFTENLRVKFIEKEREMDETNAFENFMRIFRCKLIEHSTFIIQYCIHLLQKVFIRNTFFHVQIHFIFPFLLRFWVNKEHFISFLPHVALSINRTANTTTTIISITIISIEKLAMYTRTVLFAHCAPIVIYFQCSALYWYSMHCIFMHCFTMEWTAKIAIYFLQLTHWNEFILHNAHSIWFPVYKILILYHQEMKKVISSRC